MAMLGIASGVNPVTVCEQQITPNLPWLFMCRSQLRSLVYRGHGKLPSSENCYVQRRSISVPLRKMALSPSIQSAVQHCRNQSDTSDLCNHIKKQSITVAGTIDHVWYANDAK